MDVKYVYVIGTSTDITPGSLPIKKDYNFQSVYFPTVLQAEKTLQLPSATEIYENEPVLKEDLYLSSGVNKNFKISDITVDGNSVAIPDNRQFKFDNGAQVVVTYTLEVLKDYTGAGTYKVELKYQFATVENHFPLTPYTITDCVTRCLELAEPLQKGEIPRFRFEGVTYDVSTGERNPTYTAGSQAERYDKVLAPPFTMTQCTLREQLKIIGGFIHAEPRLTDGVITFEPFCGNELAEVTLTNGNKIPLNQYPYAIRKKSQDINEYCTSVDTRVENVVNSIDTRKGSIVDPDGNNYKALRSEVINARITDTNGIATTAYPIYEIEKLTCGIAKRNPQNATDLWQLEPVDITDYVVEETAYNAILSSYDGSYPYSKAYAVYYTQGSPHIKGLFYKAPSVLDNAFKNYSIVNILSQVTGKSPKDISDDYPLYSFQITYKPIYNARFTHSKPYIDPAENPRTLFYNQSENLIETSYYGENVKGAVARLGNAQQSLTYYFNDLDNIPKAGQLFDDDNYISSVMVQVMPSYLKCTITLSKDFNRLSEYIGVKSLKYLYEVNERAAYDRSVLLKEYVVVGDYEAYPEKNSSLFIPCRFRGTTDEINGVKYWVGYGTATFRDGNIVSITEKTQDDKGYLYRFSYGNSGYISATAYVPYENTPRPTEPVIATTTVTYVTYSDENSLIGYTFMEAIVRCFNGRKATPITSVIAQAKTKSGKSLGKQITLPVIASAFGNVLTFSWKYKDNYSAGEQSVYVAGSNISGYWGQDVTYKDYYGRFDEYDFNLTAGVQYNINSSENSPVLNIPEVKHTVIDSDIIGTNISGKRYVLRVDSRETLNCNMQVEFRTNRKDIIIGSALANINPYVNSSGSSFSTKWYFFTERLNKFIAHAENQPGIDLSTAASAQMLAANGRIYPLNVPVPPSGKQWKSWAVITEQTQETMTVEDSEGNVKTITKTVGGDVVLAGNWSDPANYTVEKLTIYFTGKHKLK